MKLVPVRDGAGSGSAPELQYKGEFQDNPGTPKTVWADAILQHCNTLQPHEKIFAEQLLGDLMFKIFRENLPYREAVSTLKTYFDLIGAFSAEERSSMETFLTMMFSKDSIDSTPLPILNNRDGEENRIAVQHVLDGLPSKDGRDVALRFNIPDAEDNDVAVTLSPRAWNQWRLVHLISTNQRQLARPGLEDFYSCEVFVFFHGNRDQNGVHISSIEVPNFTVKEDTVTFVTASRINAQNVMGTSHVHPGGSEWSTLSDLDFSGFVNDVKVHFPNVLFNAVQAKNAFLAPFPSQSRAFQYVSKRAIVIGGAGISPVESLRPLRAPIVAVPFGV